MIKFNKDFNAKIISLLVAVLFLFNSAVYGIGLPSNTPPNKLRVPVGNSYERMLQVMQQKYEEHEASLDEKIKKLAKDSKSLSEISGLEREFKAIIENGGFEDTFNRLNSILVRTGGRIQVIFVNSVDDLPIFGGKPVWGHAGTYITVFALIGGDKTQEGRRKIIGKIFHEIRARSTIAKKRFDEVNWSALSEQAAADKVKELWNKFEEENHKIQRQIETEGKISDESLFNEFKALEFNEQVSNRLRDYAVTERQMIEKLESEGVIDIEKLRDPKQEWYYINGVWFTGSVSVLRLVEYNIGKPYLRSLIKYPDERVKLYVELEGSAFPPIKVFYTSWFSKSKRMLHIRDGHHRTAAAFIRRDEFISAEICYVLEMEGSPSPVFNLLRDGKPLTRAKIAKKLGRLSNRGPFSERTIQPDLAFLIKAGVIERVGVATYQLRPELKGKKALLDAIQKILDKEFQYGRITENLRNKDNRAKIAAEIQILIKMPKGKTITVDDVYKKLGISKRMAHSALKSLVKNNVLVGRSGIYYWAVSGGSGEGILHENRKDQADKLVTEGEAARQQGQYNTARHAWEVAISIYNEIGEFGLAQTVQGMLDRLEEEIGHRRVRDQI